MKSKRDRRREEKIYHTLIHSPNDCGSQGWTRPKPGGRFPIQVAGAQVLIELPTASHVH